MIDAKRNNEYDSPSLKLTSYKKLFFNLVNLQTFFKFTENCMCIPQFYKAFSKYKITIAMFMHK